MPLRWQLMLLGKEHEHSPRELVLSQSNQSCTGQPQTLRPCKLVDAQQMEAPTQKPSAVLSQDQRQTHPRSGAPPARAPTFPRVPQFSRTKSFIQKDQGAKEKDHAHLHTRLSREYQWNQMHRRKEHKAVPRWQKTKAVATSTGREKPALLKLHPKFQAHCVKTNQPTQW